MTKPTGRKIIEKSCGNKKETIEHIEFAKLVSKLKITFKKSPIVKAKIYIKPFKFKKSKLPTIAPINEKTDLRLGKAIEKAMQNGENNPAILEKLITNPKAKKARLTQISCIFLLT